VSLPSPSPIEFLKKMQKNARYQLTAADFKAPVKFGRIARAAHRESASSG
jgi:hypothetical protein